MRQTRLCRKALETIGRQYIAKRSCRHSSTTTNNNNNINNNNNNNNDINRFTVGKLLDSHSTKQDVTVFGHVRSIRNQKARSFLSIGDGSSLEPLQALLTPQQAQNLTTGSAVCLSGKWQPSPNNKSQSHELHVQNIDILASADAATFPLQKKYHSPEFLRTIPHIRARTPFNALMLRFRSQSIANITRFFAERDFVQTQPPIITSSDCEGAGEVFNVATADRNAKADTSGFFRTPKYLTVSSQLHLEALAHAVGKVWTLSPTFRAEKSDTARHLSEFYMLEAELNFVDDMNKIMDVIEDMLRELVTSLQGSKIGQELLSAKRYNQDGKEVGQAEFTEMLQGRWQGMIDGSWPRISYTEAIKLLKSSTCEFEHTPEWGLGLQAEHERYIASHVGQGKPVFVTRYPQKIKPFYMLPTTTPEASDRETVDCFDLLVPETCEIVGGSMREYRFEELARAMQSHGLLTKDADLSDPEVFGGMKWYADLRRWGSVPHGGFGLGFDRLLGYLSGVQNIREVVAFPRWVGRCDC